MTPIGEIYTKRLHLRALQPHDAPALQKLANNFEIARWLERMPHPYSMDHAYEVIERHKSLNGRVKAIFWDDIFVGMVGVEENLGYWLGQDFWGKGLMLEAVHAMIDAYFAVDKSTLRSGYIEGNNASARVLEKAGFEYVGESIADTMHRKGVNHIDLLLTYEAYLAKRAE